MSVSPSNPVRRVAVIGAGITGLAAAHRIRELDPSCELALFDSADRVGGVLDTVRRDGFLIEQSADQFITDVPWALNLCQRLGLDDELESPDMSRRRAFVVRSGRLREVPEGFVLMAPRKLTSVATTPILSLRGKLRLASEFLVARRTDSADESIASFVRRRLGHEAYDRLVAPLVGGIYAGDAEKLSIHATLPRFPDMERRHGSLIRAARHQNKIDGINTDSAARYGLFVAPRAGMAQLISALVERIDASRIRLNTSIQQIEPSQRGWSLTLQRQGEPSTVHDTDAVVVALPANRAAPLLAEVDSQLSHTLTQIPYGGCLVVTAGYRRDQIADPLNGFGFVVPPIENRRVLACSYGSNKFPGRAPSGHVLLRTFLGGAHAPELIDADEQQLDQIIAEELGQLLGLKGPPQFRDIVRYPHHMPQYHIGHADRVAEIESRAAKIARLELAGAAYHGVGMPHCIHSGEQAAQRALGQTVDKEQAG